jgi:Lipase (class 3)
MQTSRQALGECRGLIEELDMPFATGYDSTEAQLLITLSGFSYMDSSPLPGETVVEQEARMRRDIDAALADSAYSNWHVAWGPGLSGDRANMLYAVVDSHTGQLAVAIRGTEWEFWLNWIEDFASVLPLVPYTDVLPSVAAGAPEIAVGTNIGLQLLLQTEARGPDGQETDLATFLAQAGSDAETFVTGHSLGGCLASVLAPSLAYRLGSASTLKVYTFAAPTAGNQDFADYYDQLFVDSTGGSRSFRVYNNLDIVPSSWAALPSIAASYAPAPPCSQRMKDLIARVEEIVGGVYVQTGRRLTDSAHALRGELTAPLAVPLTPDRGSLLFFYEVGQQHATETYMRLLEAPVIPASLATLMAAARQFNAPEVAGLTPRSASG